WQRLEHPVRVGSLPQHPGARKGAGLVLRAHLDPVCAGLELNLARPLTRDRLAVDEDVGTAGIRLHLDHVSTPLAHFEAAEELRADVRELILQAVDRSLHGPRPGAGIDERQSGAELKRGLLLVADKDLEIGFGILASARLTALGEIRRENRQRTVSNV